jgi:hypothetical protein
MTTADKARVNQAKIPNPKALKGKLAKPNTAPAPNTHAEERLAGNSSQVG